MWNKIKDLFKSEKDIIIEDQRKTIERLQQELKEKSNEIFSLYDIVDMKEYRKLKQGMKNG